MHSQTIRTERPIALEPVFIEKPWGHESWLNSTRSGGEAAIVAAGAAGKTSLAAAIAARPDMLGAWSRLLFGDRLPIFTKILHARFPPFVHIGFQRKVARAELLGWLEREQGSLRRLRQALELESAARFEAFATRYGTWATEQALVRWKRDNDDAIAHHLSSFVRPDDRPGLAALLGDLRRNRAQLVNVLNEVDLRRERGNLLLTDAGVLHAIFGLSHQTHPKDTTRPALEALFARLHELNESGATDRDRLHAVATFSTRNKHGEDPKNEAWYPLITGDGLTLVEPQQSSDTTYSLADFYTPFVWSGQRVAFRKGDPQAGLDGEQLRSLSQTLQLEATRIDQVRHAPVPLAARSEDRARLFRLVDDACTWPFFSVYRLELAGSASRTADWHSEHALGIFQQLVVVEGELELADRTGVIARLTKDVSAFVPATATGGYSLRARDDAAVLIFSPPSARGSMFRDNS